MYFGMMFDTFLNAFVLSGILFLVARHEADFEFKKVAIVAAFISMGNLILAGMLFLSLQQLGFEGPLAFLIWAGGSVVLICAFFIFMIMRFCWVPFLKALLVLALFMGFKIAHQVILYSLKGKDDSIPFMAANQLMHDPEEEAAAGTDGEALKILADLLESAKRSAAPTASATQASEATPPQPATIPAPVRPSKPTPPATGRTKEDWQEAQKLIKVTGMISQGSTEPPAYSVNGRLVMPGDTVTVQYKNQSYSWTLEEVTATSMRWTPVDAD